MKVSSLIAAVLFAGTTMTGVVFADEKAAAPKAAEAQMDKTASKPHSHVQEKPACRKACRMPRPINQTQLRTRASTTIREMVNNCPAKAPKPGPDYFSHGYPQTGRARRSVCVSHTGAGGRL